MSKITSDNKNYTGKLSYETLKGMVNIPQWLQPLLKYNGVYVGREEPTDNDMLVWINPEGEGKDFVTQEEMEKYVQDSMAGGVSLDNYYTKDETNHEIETAVQNIDLTPYATKLELEQYDTSNEVDAKIAAIEIPEVDLTGYAKETWVTEQLTPYATKSEIPDVSNFATKSEIPSLDGYAQETWVTEQLNPYALKTEIPDTSNFATKEEIPDVSNFATKSEIPSLDGYATETYVNEKLADVTIPVATTTTAGKVKPDGTTITVDEDGTIHSAGGGGGSSVSIDNKTIVQNEDGTIGTAIGGCWVDGLVDGPIIVDLNTTSENVSSIITYDVMQTLINTENLMANVYDGYAKETAIKVQKDTSVENTYKLYFYHTSPSSVGIHYTGTGTKDNWTCKRGFINGGANFYNTGNNFYAVVNGKVPSPIVSANFIPLSEDFIVQNDALKLNWLQLTDKKGFAFNYNNKNNGADSTGENSISSGTYTKISGENSIGVGNSIYVSGYCNAAFGDQLQNYNNAQYSFICGQIGSLRKNTSFVSGVYSNWYGSTFGTGTQVFGQGNSPCSDWSMASGKWSVHDTDKQYARIIGNGTDNNNRSNAYTLDWSGNATFAGTVSSAGADYAEFFEWKDGNTEAEDRVGCIVTLDGDKIKLASSDDDILGIISGTATVLGDNAEWYWNKRWLTDDFGRTLYEDREVTHEAVYGPGGDLIKDEWTEVVHAPIINPSYNPSQPYINRRNRPEWSAVGMMGKLYVRDDGTAQVNSYVTAKDGIATHSDSKTNMRVMKRVTDNIILVCLK